MNEQTKYYLGIDLGGTMIKGGMICSDGTVLYKTQIPTETDKGTEVVIANIVKLCNLLCEKTNIALSSVVGCGIGIPGVIDSVVGEVIFSGNLGWEHVQVVVPVTTALGIPVKITNDANAAALGEAVYGVGKEFKNSVFITLGTGVGSGIVIDNKLYEGDFCAGGEIGHMVIAMNGEQCTCGRRGCFEAYASATALIRDTKRAMESHKESKMWQAVDGDITKVKGETSFGLMNDDETAGMVVENYITSLAEGLANIANIFRPEVIMLGGGVANAGEKFLTPLRAKVAKLSLAGDLLPSVRIEIATLGNDAGFFGGAGLFE